MRRTILVGVTTAILCVNLSVAYGQVETITVRSGQVNNGGGCANSVPGTPGQSDCSVTYNSVIGNPVGLPLDGSGPLDVFNPGDFSNAKLGVGVPATVIAPFSPIWFTNLSSVIGGDPDARWVNFAIGGDNLGTPGSALYAVPFDVTSTAISSATLTLECGVDDQLGDKGSGPNFFGLYINDPSKGLDDVPACNFATPTTSFHVIPPGWIIPNQTNYLFFYQRDTAAVVSGLIFSATITINGCPEDPHAVCTSMVGAGGLATVQAAYNTAVNDDVICLFANTTENVVLNGAKSLTITQCTTARVTAANNSLPVWTVSSTGKLTIIGPDAEGGSIGWLVEGDGHDIKGVRATGASQVGIKIAGDHNSVSFNSVRGSPLGVKVEGTGNDVRGGTVSGNSTGVEFSATASNNRFRGAKVRNNTGPGIVVRGPGNTLDGNRVNGNTGDGIHVTAPAAGTKLKSNQSGNPENGGAEYRLNVNAVNQGGNRADNIPIPKLSAPQKCAFFAAAGTCE